MGDLIPNHLGFEEAARSKSKQCSVTNISEWLEAFAVYVSVIARTQTQRVPDLMGYQILMIEGSNKYQSNCWLAYDRHFRQQAAAQPQCKWSNIDSTFWNLAFTGQAKVSCCKHCFSLFHLSKTVSLPPTQPLAYLTQHMEHHTAKDLFANNETSNTAKHAPFPTAAMNMYAIIAHTIQQ